LASDLPEDRFFAKYVETTFPKVLSKRYAKAMGTHYLRREIVATQISNAVVNDMGIIFVHQMQDEFGASLPTIVRAYVAAREIFEMDSLWASICALETEIAATVQLQMLEELIRLVRRSARWFLRNRRGELDVETTIGHFMPKVKQLARALTKFRKGAEQAYFEDKGQALMHANVPEFLANKIASIRAFYPALNIIDVAVQAKAGVERVAEVHFRLAEKLGLDWLRDQVDFYPIDTRWNILARSSFKGDLDRHLHQLTIAVLQTKAPSKKADVLYAAWVAKHKTPIEMWQNRLADLRACSTIDATMLAVAVLKLYELVLAGT